jgi:hypothetical protein
MAGTMSGSGVGAGSTTSKSSSGCFVSSTTGAAKDISLDAADCVETGDSVLGAGMEEVLDPTFADDLETAGTISDGDSTALHE